MEGTFAKNPRIGPGLLLYLIKFKNDHYLLTFYHYTSNSQFYHTRIRSGTQVNYHFTFKNMLVPANLRKHYIFSLATLEACDCPCFRTVQSMQLGAYACMHKPRRPQLCASPLVLQIFMRSFLETLLKTRLPP